MPDPTNPADVPATWLPRPSEPVVVSARDREIARRVKNNRHHKVVMLSELAEDHCRRVGMDAETFARAAASPSFWRLLCEVAGKAAPRTQETRDAVVAKVTEMLSEPYRAKGRGEWKT